jgi:hypothetical protein
MAKIHTTAGMYRRGISDRYPKVGANIQGNYCVVQNTNLFKQQVSTQKKNYSFNTIFLHNRLPFP